MVQQTVVCYRHQPLIALATKVSVHLFSCNVAAEIQIDCSECHLLFCLIRFAVPVTISNGPLVYVEEHQFGRSILSMVIASPVNPDPPAQNITWQHPDKQILTNSSSHFFLNNRRTLVVANSQPSDDGLYLATVDNGVGTATIQFNLTVYSK